MNENQTPQPLTDNKLVDVIVDHFYTNKTIVELSEAHNIIGTDLTAVHRTKAWNDVRDAVITEVVRIRIARKEGIELATSTPKTSKPTSATKAEADKA